MKWYVIDEELIRSVRRVATRLHSEDRMNGDEMRDLGHLLTAVADEASQIELPEELMAGPSGKFF